MTTKGDKDRNTKMPYEPPRLFDLGGVDVAYAQADCRPGGSPVAGQCKDGSMAPTEKCRSGGNAGTECRLGTAAAGYKCRSGQTAGGGECRDGGSAAGQCKAGSSIQVLREI